MAAFQTIISRKIPCYFISPHLDDAILSAGGLITYLSPKTKVTIISLFTKASQKPYTFVAKRVLQKDWGVSDAEKIFEERRKEDKKACQMAHAACIHLGYVDATWRKKSNPNPLVTHASNLLPELIHLYPYPNTIHIAKEDHWLMKKIAEELTTIIDMKKPYLVFAPIGIGKHIDHIITREICFTTFDNPIFWQDFPYNLRLKADTNFIMKNKLKEVSWDTNITKKKDLILTYASQIKGMFPNGEIPLKSEVYYFTD